MKLYFVSDKDFEQAIAGGVTMVQLRNKELSDEDFFVLAKQVRELTLAHNIPLIINDRVHIALAVDADGVHVGQSDMDAGTVRQQIGDKILGVSVTNLDEALRAVSDGADYLGVGAMFATQTKPDAVVVSFDELKRIRENVNIPIVVIGGINKNTLPQFAGLGVDGFAFVSAINHLDELVCGVQSISSSEATSTP